MHVKKKKKCFDEEVEKKEEKSWYLFDARINEKITQTLSKVYVAWIDRFVLSFLFLLFSFLLFFSFCFLFCFLFYSRKLRSRIYIYRITREECMYGGSISIEGVPTRCTLARDVKLWRIMIVEAWGGFLFAVFRRIARNLWRNCGRARP